MLEENELERIVTICELYNETDNRVYMLATAEPVRKTWSRIKACYNAYKQKDVGNARKAHTQAVYDYIDLVGLDKVHARGIARRLVENQGADAELLQSFIERSDKEVMN